jgi:hypothetical protein
MITQHLLTNFFEPGLDPCHLNHNPHGCGCDVSSPWKAAAASEIEGDLLGATEEI